MRRIAMPLLCLTLAGFAWSQDSRPPSEHAGHAPPAETPASAPASGATASGSTPQAVEGLDPLRDAGVPDAERIAAIKKKHDSMSLAAATLAELEACDACLGRNEFAAILAAQPAADLKALAPTLVAKAKDSPSRFVKAACIRAIFALPEADRPAEAAQWKPVMLKTATVPGTMTWNPKEFTVAPGAVVAIEMSNPDTMSHNMLVLAPGSLMEVGVASDKLGEGLLGKQRQYVPDSPKVLEIMGFAPPNTSRTLWFIAPGKIGTYPLICTYPGHWRMMNGKLKVQ